MPHEFQRFGIRFQYPDNWTLDEADALTGAESVTVYSPGGGFWTLSVHPPTIPPHQLSQAAVEAMRDEYEELEVDEIREDVAGHDMVGYDLSFYCLDLINTARVRSVHADQATYTVFCQAEDREFDQVRQVFEAMTVSLLDGVPRPSSSA